METCPKCQSLLQIGTSFYTFENDDTPDKPTIAYTNLPRLCVNKECENYCGKDVSNPQYVVEVTKNQLNQVNPLNEVVK